MVHGENSGVRITKLDEEVDSEVVHKIDRSVQSNQNEEAEITLYALTGTPTPGTMRVKGRVNGDRLVILIDTGSTHNFVDVSLISGLQLRVDVTKVLEVKVANGVIVKTQGFCSEVPVIVQGVEFCINFHFLELGGYDAILGTQWLSTLGEIQWNFKLMTMSLWYRNKQVLLQGLSSNSGSSFVDCKKFFNASMKRGLLLQIDGVQPAASVDRIPAEVDSVLQEFGQVFETPTKLPPLRGHEHSIMLKEGA